MLLMARRPRFLFWPIWENFASVLRSPEVWRCLMNSTIVATGTTNPEPAAGAPAACVQSRHRFAGAAAFGFWILSTRLTSPVAILIPFFILCLQTGTETSIGCGDLGEYSRM